MEREKVGLEKRQHLQKTTHTHKQTDRANSKLISARTKLKMTSADAQHSEAHWRQMDID